MSKNRSFGEFELLRRLTETPGIPGREERVRDLLIKETKGLWDETRVDAMGNLICLKRAAKQPQKSRASSRSAKGKSADGPPKVMIGDCPVLASPAPRGYDNNDGMRDNFMIPGRSQALRQRNDCTNPT